MDAISIYKTGENFCLIYDTNFCLIYDSFAVHSITPEEAKYKFCKVRKIFVSTKGIPHLVTHDARTVNDTIQIDFETGKITDLIKFDTGNLCMVTGGANLGRIGVITNRERHPGSFDVVHLKDANGNSFATRLSNIFVIGKGNKPWISLPRGKGICLIIAEKRNKRLAAKQSSGLKNENPQPCYKYFISVGGLDVLAQVLMQLESDSHETLSSAKLAVVVTKTMDACIADNPTFGIVLCKYHIVSKLLALLLHESLDSGEKFSIMLTLGHCTEDCEENQYDLFKHNGLPLMIQALTESQNEELNKAATFVLYNCKKITEKLSLSLGEYPFDENETQQLKDINVNEKNFEEHWKKAKEILHRIEQLEREENREEIQRENYQDNISSMNISIQNTWKNLHGDHIGRGTKAEDKDKSHSGQLQSYKSHGVMSKTCTNDDQMKTPLKSANPVHACYRQSERNKTLYKAKSNCNQNLHEETFENNFASQSSDHVFKHPVHIAKNIKQQLPVTGMVKNVSLLMSSHNRNPICCIAVEKSLNSRNFSKLLHSCPYQCDRHRVIVEAEDRYKSELRKSLICNKKTRRIRKNFTEEEVNYLFSGVKKMGNHWNLILWSFPFQQGRKAVDLAHKYHKLTKRPECAAS
ncbi:Telomere repeats-binding bouquet formation protein 1 [Saguinus oedipus]|uniref:Telomere repeats-binding bouquet formation protein 1 n=1 Tax=Saguinus oedipus TaxID=9490 RepID=A0ABQ9TKB8_SAGOE|nr:Telomere repeats-binding bouquet formation protein 1 [Saguinus oedipus]